MQTFKIPSLDDMKTFAINIAQQGYQKILLTGELGAGKTTFTKAYIQALGGQNIIVKSPTFTYYNIYEFTLTKNQQSCRLFHGDFYRVESSDTLIQKGITDVMDDFDYLLVERPKFYELYTDESRIHITINIINEVEREITIHTKLAE